MSKIKNKIYVFKFDDKDIMRKINRKSSESYSFKYTVLISLHCYNIFFQPERISKLKSFEKQHNFILITPTEFETNKRIYTTKDDSTNKAHIVQLKNNRYVELKPLKNKFMRLDKILKSFSHKELKEYILSCIHANDPNNTNGSNK